MGLLEQSGVGGVRTTFGDYLQGWLEVKVTDIELNTAASYRRWVGHIAKNGISRLALDRVTSLALEQCYRELLVTPARHGRPLAPASVRHCHALLENALGDAVRQQLLPSNPATYAKAPRGQSPAAAHPSAEQIGALLDDLARHNAPLVDLAILFIGTGLRRSEALGLRFGDIDWMERRIAIRQVVTEHAGQWSLRQGTKSRAGLREIGIDTVVVEALRRQQAAVAEVRLKIGRFWQDHDLVFPDVTCGGPRSPAAVTHAFTRATKRISWPAHCAPVHGLRHAAASLTLASNGDLAAVSARLGHSSPAVTARIYIHSDTARDRAAANVMGSLARRKIVP